MLALLKFIRFRMYSSCTKDYMKCPFRSFFNQVQRVFFNKDDQALQIPFGNGQWLPVIPEPEVFIFSIFSLKFRQYRLIMVYVNNALISCIAMDHLVVISLCNQV